MPEGDTVHKVAGAIRPELVGRRLRRVEIAGRDTPSLRRRVVRVVALGKHLFVELEQHEALRSHLGVFGAWHRYSPRETWHKPRWQASLALWTNEAVLVCFNAKEVECLDARRLGLHPLLSRLGPDLLAPAVDLAAVVERARRLVSPQAPVVDLLLEQQVACGIGNVYKNEVLFLAGVHPATPCGEISDETLGKLFASAREQLQSNLGGWMRTTTVDRRRGRELPGLPRLWVYGRAGAACLRCSRRIEYRRLGRGGRDTYWCPACQPESRG